MPSSLTSSSTPGSSLGRRSGEQVIECQHRVGLAAAEVGLQLDDRIASLAGQPRYGLRQQPAQAFGEKRAAEELGRDACTRPMPSPW